MTEKTMTLEEVKDQVAKEMMFDNYRQAGLDRLSIDIIAIRFASQESDRRLEEYKQKLKDKLNPASAIDVKFRDLIDSTD